MSSLDPVSTVCFIACEKSAAEHFATFIEKRPSDVNNVRVYGSNGYVWERFLPSGVKPIHNFNPDSESPEAEAQKIAKACLESNISVVMTDVGHPFDVHLQQAFATYAPNIFRIAYYENLYPYVADNEGVYSKTASAVMSQAQMVLFANANLARHDAIVYETPDTPVDLSNQTKKWVGFYPNEESRLFYHWRSDPQWQISTIMNFFDKTGLHLLQKKSSDFPSVATVHKVEVNVDFSELDSPENMVEKAQKMFTPQLYEQLPSILVYYGENDEGYFTRGFPAFLNLLQQAIKTSSLKHLIIVLQQHPDILLQQKDGYYRRDALALLAWKKINIKNPNAPTLYIPNVFARVTQVAASGAIYYQITNALQLAFAGIPLLQVGDTVHPDFLVQHQFVSALTPDNTTGEQFASALCHLEKLEIDVDRLYKTVGCIVPAVAVKNLWDILKNPSYESEFEDSEDEDSEDKEELNEVAEPKVREAEESENEKPNSEQPLLPRKFQINPSHWPYCLAATIALVSLVALAVRFWRVRVK